MSSEVYRKETVVPVNTAKNRLKFFRVVECINLACEVLLCLRLLYEDSVVATIDIKEENKVKVGLWTFEMANGEKHHYKDLMDETSPYGEIARVSTGVAVVTYFFVAYVILIGSTCIYLKWKPFRNLFIWMEGTVLSCYTGIVTLKWYLAENGTFFKVLFYPDRPKKESEVWTPLAGYIQNFLPITLCCFIATTWMIMEYTSASNQHQDQVIEISHPREEDNNNNPQNANFNGDIRDNDAETADEEDEKFTPANVRPLSPDFALDTYSVYFLTTTKSFRRHVQTERGRRFVQIGCIVCCMAQMLAMSSLFAAKRHSFNFGGTEEYIELRVVLMVIVTYLLFGDIMDTASRAALPIFLPAQCFVRHTKTWLRLMERLISFMLFFGQLTISVVLMPQLCIKLMSIEDSEGTLGILADFTAFVVLMEIDNMVVGGVLAIMARFDNSISVAAAEAITEEFFDYIKPYNTENRRYYTRFMMNILFFTLFVGYVVINYPLYIYRFQNKAYLVWPDDPQHGHCRRILSLPKEVSANLRGEAQFSTFVLSIFLIYLFVKKY